MSGTKVEARVGRGLRDLLPEQMLARQWMIDVIKGVYEVYGFVPLDTPAIEYLDVLTGSSGEEMEHSIYEVVNPEMHKEQQRLGLRFDLTVPLARVVAQYVDLPRPFRRYQVSSVWRTDKPGAGRFREFTQFDLDTVGAESDVADTEIIAGMCDTLEALNVGAYRVRFSSRRVLSLLLPFAGIPDAQAANVFRVLDKLDKAGLDKVKLELTTGYTDESGDPIKGLGLSKEQVAKIERFLEIASEQRDELLGQLRETFVDLPEAPQEIDVLERISRHLYALGYGDDRVSIDLSVARGLAYYTGPVFEAVLMDAPEFGSIFGGGRYDDLVMRFLGERISATGASIGVDRLLAALIHLGRVPLQRSTAMVLVTALDPSMTEDYLKMTFELRRAGIPTELYLDSKGLRKQIKYADQRGIPVAILYGEDEKAKGVVALKDLAQGRARSAAIKERQEWIQERPGQIEVPRAGLVSAVRDMLSNSEGST
ncbi:MAG: histidine--tRNA ligase [Planctomycetota bacterium]